VARAAAGARRPSGSSKSRRLGEATVLLTLAARNEDAVATRLRSEKEVVGTCPGSVRCP
jgi:hypothetical protein